MPSRAGAGFSRLSGTHTDECHVAGIVVVMREVDHGHAALAQVAVEAVAVSQCVGQASRYGGYGPIRWLGNFLANLEIRRTARQFAVKSESGEWEEAKSGFTWIGRGFLLERLGIPHPMARLGRRSRCVAKIAQDQADDQVGHGGAEEELLGAA